MKRYSILVCRGPECGGNRGSSAIYDELRRELVARGLLDAGGPGAPGAPGGRTGAVALGWQSCFGRCTQGPNALVREVLPGDVTPTPESLRLAAGAPPTNPVTKHGLPAPSKEQMSQAQPRFAFATPKASRGTLTALYNRLTANVVRAIVEGHLLGGRIQQQLIERPVIGDARSTPTAPAAQPVARAADRDPEKPDKGRSR
jgi:(2Fe-2S) ferredoxin